VELSPPPSHDDDDDQHHQQHHTCFPPPFPGCSASMQRQVLLLLLRVEAEIPSTAVPLPQVHHYPLSRWKPSFPRWLAGRLTHKSPTRPVLTLDRQTQDYCCCFRESNLPNPTHLPTQQNAGRRECSAAEQYTYLAARNTKHKRPRHLLYYNLLTTTKKSALFSHSVLLRTASEQANGNQIATYSLVCSAPEKRANERATSSCRASSSSADLPLSLSLPLCAAGAPSEAPLLSSLPFPFVSFPSFLPWQCDSTSGYVSWSILVRCERTPSTAMDCVRRHPAFFHLRRSICTTRETNMRAFHPPQLHHIITRTRNFFHPPARPGPTSRTICRSRAKFAARERVATAQQ
jgi:hypothetical protein